MSTICAKLNRALLSAYLAYVEMLKISKMADYAGVVAVCMAAHPEAVHTASSLSSQTGLAQTTVAKCLKLLARYGVLISQRGVNGGYVLARHPQDIAVSDIIEALEGKVKITDCTDHQDINCQISHCCPMRGGWDSLNGKIYQVLRSTSLADMVGK